MDGAAWLAIAALSITALTAVLTFGPLRLELTSCKRERIELRQRLELVISVIIRTLPMDERLDLLVQLDERIKGDEL